MDKESLISILKVILVLGFIIAPQIIKALAKRNNAKTNLPPTPSSQQRNKIKTTHFSQKKSFVKPKPRKNVEDIFAELFGGEEKIVSKPKQTQKRTPVPSRANQQEVPPKNQYNIKAEKKELPRFKTSIKEFKTNIPSLPDDIKSFESNIHTSTETIVQTSPLLQKFKKIDREDLRYGIIISEILGPPVSLKSDSLM